MIRSEISQLEPLEVALAAFQQQYPTFATTRVLDELNGQPVVRIYGPTTTDRRGGSPAGCPAHSSESLM